MRGGWRLERAESILCCFQVHGAPGAEVDTLYLEIAVEFLQSEEKVRYADCAGVEAASGGHRVGWEGGDDVVERGDELFVGVAAGEGGVVGEVAGQWL